MIDSPEQSQVGRNTVEKRRWSMQNRAVVSGALGSALEWFDFGVYGALSATLFPQLFFSELGPAGAAMASFATFGVGFLARPLGGIVFGHLGDRFGRRPVLLATFITMGLASALIGLLPVNGSFEVALCLVLLRFVQGFSLGGEVTGAQLMTLEHAKGNSRGIRGALMNVGSPFSQVLANLVLLLLSASLTAEQFAQWGWRIPFIGGLLLVALGIYIRLRLQETPIFVAASRTKAGNRLGLGVLVSQPRTVLTLVLVWAAPVTVFYVIAVYGLAYLIEVSGFDRSSAFLVTMVGNAVSVVFTLLGGWVSDRIGRRPVLFIGYAGCFIGVASFVPASASGSLPLVILSVTLTLSSALFQFGAQPAFFAEQFPTRTRFAGSALALTLSGVLFAAPAPLVATMFSNAGEPRLIFWVVCALNVGSAVALFCLRERGEELMVNDDEAAVERGRAPEAVEAAESVEVRA